MEYSNSDSNNFNKRLLTDYENKLNKNDFLYKEINPMRKISKLSLFLLLVLVFSSETEAQIIKRPRALLFGNLAYVSPYGAGLDANYRGGVAGEFGGGLGLGKTMLTGSIGYQLISSRSGVAAGNLRIIPIKVGIRRYLVGSIFLQANGGIASQSYAHNGPSGSSFVYELGGGLKLLKLLELQLTTNSWKQPSASARSNALFFKAGWSIRL